MKRSELKRIVSLLIALTMIFSLVPVVPALAVEGGEVTAAAEATTPRLVITGRGGNWYAIDVIVDHSDPELGTAEWFEEGTAPFTLTATGGLVTGTGSLSLQWPLSYDPWNVSYGVVGTSVTFSEVPDPPATAADTVTTNGTIRVFEGGTADFYISSVVVTDATNTEVWSLDISPELVAALNANDGTEVFGVVRAGSPVYAFEGPGGNGNGNGGEPDETPTGTPPNGGDPEPPIIGDPQVPNIIRNIVRGIWGRTGLLQEHRVGGVPVPDALFALAGNPAWEAWFNANELWVPPTPAVLSATSIPWDSDERVPDVEAFGDFIGPIVIHAVDRFVAGELSIGELSALDTLIGAIIVGLAVDNRTWSVLLAGTMPWFRETIEQVFEIIDQTPTDYSCDLNAIEGVVTNITGTGANAIFYIDGERINGWAFITVSAYTEGIFVASGARFFVDGVAQRSRIVRIAGCGCHWFLNADGLGIVGVGMSEDDLEAAIEGNPGLVGGETGDWLGWALAPGLPASDDGWFKMFYDNEDGILYDEDSVKVYNPWYGFTHVNPAPGVYNWLDDREEISFDFDAWGRATADYDCEDSAPDFDVVTVTPTHELAETVTALVVAVVDELFDGTPTETPSETVVADAVEEAVETALAGPPVVLPAATTTVDVAIVGNTVVVIIRVTGFQPIEVPPIMIPADWRNW